MKSFAIIGLSSFGNFLALELVKQGVEVLAVDLAEEKIEKIKHLVHRAVIADAADKDALAALDPVSFSGVVVSVGQIEASVLAALHLKELKVKSIIAKALSPEHGRILERIGVTEVIFPEKDMAERLARTISSDNIIEHIPLAKGYSIVEIAPPMSFLHKSLKELDLRKHYGVQVIVIKEIIHDNVVMVPTADYIIKDSDVLVLMGQDKDLKRVQKG